MRLVNPLNVHREALREDLRIAYFGSYETLFDRNPYLMKISKKKVVQAFRNHPDIHVYDYFYIDMITHELFVAEDKLKTSSIWLIKTGMVMA